MLRCLLIVLVSLCTIVSAGGDEAREQLAALAKAYDKALASGDREFLEKLYDEDGKYIVHDGAVLSRDAYVDQHVAAEVKWLASESQTEALRVLGDIAIEIGTWKAEGNKNGTKVHAKERYTTVWRRRGTSWVIVAEQTTPILGKP